MTRTLRNIVSAAAITLLSSGAYASSIDVTLTATPSMGSPGDLVSLDIDLTVAPADVFAGSFDVFFDSTVLSFQSLDLMAASTNFGVGQLGPIDTTTTPGVLDNVNLGSLFGFFSQGSGSIGTLIFQVISPPPVPTGTSVTLGNQQFVGLLGAIDASEIRLTGTVITSTVPLPAAFWFFGTALVGLITMKKRQSGLQRI